MVPLDDTVAGYVFRSRQGRVFSLEEAAAISQSTGEIMGREGLHSICCIPLVSHGNALGTLNLGSRREAFFTEGDLQFFTQAADQVAIALENARSFQRIEELNARLAEEKVYLEDEIRTDNRFEEIVGQSRALKAVLKQVETVAPTDSTVLIYGETGTGKELLARAIHDLSSRRQGTFVKLNCAAIPMGLLESEMFGHEKGAFTGAIAQRIGRFELANHGTMFLDEVGEIPLELQTKLLRVLAGTGVRTARQFAHHPHRCPPGRGDQSRSGRAGGGAAISRRPLLSPERLPHHGAAAARPPRRHSAAGPLFRAAVRAPHESAASPTSRPMPCRRSRAIRGRATFANCRTSSNAR